VVTEVVSAVLQTSFLGDMVLTTPLLERLAREGPVHVVATPANAGVLANHPAVASVIVFDKRRSDAGWRGFARVAARLRAVGASRAFLAQGSLRTAALALMARIPVRIGFDRSAGRLLYTRRVHYRAEWHHAARLWSLATAADAPHSESAPALRPSLYPGATEDAQVDGLLQQAGLDIDTPLIALAPGSVWATKRWPHYPTALGGGGCSARRDWRSQRCTTGSGHRRARPRHTGAAGDRCHRSAVIVGIRSTAGTVSCPGDQ